MIARVVEPVDTQDLKSCGNCGREGSIPSSSTENGRVVQLVRIHACHAWGRGFESRPDRKMVP